MKWPLALIQKWPLLVVVFLGSVAGKPSLKTGNTPAKDPICHANAIPIMGRREAMYRYVCDKPSQDGSFEDVSVASFFLQHGSIGTVFKSDVAAMCGYSCH